VNKTTNWLDQVIQVQIEKVAHGGIFVARHEGRVVFVSHVLPGEIAKVRVFEDKGGSFCRAEPIEIVEASPDRVPHIWNNAELAGGAEFGHIKLSRQRELKADVLQEGLARFAGIDLRVEVQSAPGDDEANGLGYRTRVQLHVDENGDAGPYKERSHDVVRVKKLPLAVADIEELGLHTKNWQDVKKIEIAYSSTGQLQWTIDKKLKGEEKFIERAGGRTFRLSAGAFWQVHKEAANLLAAEVVAMAKAQNFDSQAQNYDLYGGVGLFSGALASAFGLDLKITTVEAAKNAAEDARRNLVDIKGAKSIALPTERFLDELASHGKLKAKSTVIIDPPRAGAGKHVIERLLELSPSHLIYVACDPIALSRDLKPLTEAGYKIAKIASYDLFPHTHHFETIVSLVK
jgi:tRNA/tmRNA/rRNA uracil-C5-methylase (TrmA/RlmC/RlmD family)